MLQLPDLGQFALLLLFVPAAMGMIVGLILFRKARAESTARRSRALAAAGVGLGLFGLLVIVSAFVQMVGRDPALLLPYDLGRAGTMTQATRIGPIRPVATPAALFVARATLVIEGPLWGPWEPTREPDAFDLSFTPDLGRHGRGIAAAGLLLRAAEIAHDDDRRGGPLTDLAVARRILADAKDSVLRSDRLQEQIQCEIGNAIRLGSVDLCSGEFELAATATEPDRAVAIAIATAGGIVYADAEAIHREHRLQLEDAQAAVRDLETDLRRENARLSSWQADPHLSRDLPLVRARIEELEDSLAQARPALARLADVRLPKEPRVHVISLPLEARPVDPSRSR